MKKRLFFALLIVPITFPLFSFQLFENTHHITTPQFAIVNKAVPASGRAEGEVDKITGTDRDNTEIRHHDAVIQNLESLSDNTEILQELKETDKEDGMAGYDDARLYYKLGVSLNNASMNKKAVEAYKKAIEINPNYIEAYYNLALSYLILNDKAAALEKCKLLKNLAPKIAENLYNYASVIASLNIVSGYVVQVGAYKSLDNARKIIEKLNSDYLYVYIDKTDNLNKVKINGIQTIEEANLIIQEIREKIKLKPYLIGEQ